MAAHVDSLVVASGDYEGHVFEELSIDTNQTKKDNRLISFASGGMIHTSHANNEEEAFEEVWQIIYHFE